MAKNKVSGQGKPAKGKGKGKGKGQDKSDVGGKEETQESSRDHKWNNKTDEIKVRHILCEKHSRKEEALARLKAGENFHDVALIYAEHKRDEGKSCSVVLIGPEH
ncbi:hypothetical protein INS49_006677 [Diaporthe citri]|uniref:uncharacterized protein n=1 Tax=Diaporthe citri TaxID=83186 RepID=UPI001C7EF333|nr:uncharacterized protein INS49_006677 [Diaporthe citri]KAG6365071.1 hypothetical protein INS49_006677 [Diaporthe citri]